jgi:small subunit ribosomal protein S16
MALKIRMARGGRKKSPSYRIVVADARAPRDGKFIEKVGTYNPMMPKDNPARLVLDVELCKKWIAEGAEPSERVASFLGQAGIIAMPAKRQSVEKAKPKAKALEMIRQKEEKATAAVKAAEEAAAAAEEAKNAPAVEEVAEEVVAEAPAAEEATEEKAAE